MKILKEKMNEGFSLVELVMVMVILGILAAVAVPKMTSVLNQAAVRAEKTTVDTIWAGCESYASDKLIETGTEVWPYNPLTVMGRTRNIKINLTLGVPDEDNEWQFDGTNLYHRRMNNEIWYYQYNPNTFFLSEHPSKL